MTTNYILKKSNRVYVTADTDSPTSYYPVDVEDFSINQTRTFETYSKKTLHDQNNLSDAAKISKLNPGNLELTVNIVETLDVNGLTPGNVPTGHSILINALLDPINHSNFGIVVVEVDTKGMIFANHCVITEGTFIIQRDEVLKVRLRAEFESFIKKGAADSQTILDGATFSAAEIGGVGNFQKVNYLSAQLPTTDTEIPCVTRLSVEVQNSIDWVPYATVHKAISNTVPGPTNFVMKKRTVSGSIEAYYKPMTSAESSGQVESFTHANGHGENKTLILKAGSSSSSGLEFNLLNCYYTNRLNTGSVFTQNYDWSMTDSPTDLTDSSSNTRSYIKQIV